MASWSAFKAFSIFIRHVGDEYICSDSTCLFCSICAMQWTSKPWQLINWIAMAFALSGLGPRNLHQSWVTAKQLCELSSHDCVPNNLCTCWGSCIWEISPAFLWNSSGKTRCTTNLHFCTCGLAHNWPWAKVDAILKDCWTHSACRAQWVMQFHHNGLLIGLNACMVLTECQIQL